MNTALATIKDRDYTLTEQQQSIVSRSVETGDLSGLTAQDRSNYYFAMCDRYGLDPLSRPFDYIESREKKDNNWIKKLAIYPNQKAGAQMRRIHGITIQIVSRENQGDIFVVVARATRRDGSSDEAMGVVSLIGYEDKPLTGNQKANAMMKAEGKARQRATMAVCGLLSSEGDEELSGDRVIRSEALDGGLEAEVLDDAQLMELRQARSGKRLIDQPEIVLIPDGLKLSEKISIKIEETGLSNKAIAAMLKENNYDPKAVDNLPVSEHDRVLRLIDGLAGVAT